MAPSRRAEGACVLCGDGKATTPTRRWARASFATFTFAMSGAFLALGLHSLWIGTRPFAQHLLDLARHGELARTRVEAVALLVLIALRSGLVVGLSVRAAWRWQRDRSSLYSRGAMHERQNP